MAYQKTVPTPTDASIILTYRCPMKCKMCNIWFNPTNKSEEIKASDLRTLPKLKFINLTGGEPFVREDLAEIVEECYRHTDPVLSFRRADGLRIVWWRWQRSFQISASAFPSRG